MYAHEGRYEAIHVSPTLDPTHDMVIDDKKPQLFRVGDEKLPMLYRDYFISHEIRIPSLTNQNNGMSQGFWSLLICLPCISLNNLGSA